MITGHTLIKLPLLTIHIHLRNRHPFFDFYRCRKDLLCQLNIPSMKNSHIKLENYNREDRVITPFCIANNISKLEIEDDKEKARKESRKQGRGKTRQDDKPKPNPN